MARNGFAILDSDMHVFEYYSTCSEAIERQRSIWVFFSSLLERKDHGGSGYKILDSDMHVYEPHDLYLNYMDPKWGDRIPRGQPRKKHGQMHFSFGDGTPYENPGRLSLSATSKTHRRRRSCPAKRK